MGAETNNDTDTAAERVVIRKRAMDLLARREHARAELAAKLAKREHARNDIECVLDELSHDGLLSETRYADAMVASRAGRGMGPMRIRAELAAVQIDEAEIDRALADAGVDWFELAVRVRAKRFGPDAPADFPAKAKQMRFLQQRGFQGDEITAAVEDRGG